MQHSPKLDLDKRNQMPTYQWRASLLHFDCMSVHSVDPRQLVVAPRVMPDQVVHEALPLGLPDRWILHTDVLARQCSTSPRGSRTCCLAVAPAAAVALFEWLLPSLPIFEALHTCCDRFTMVSLH